MRSYYVETSSRLAGHRLVMSPRTTDLRQARRWAAAYLKGAHMAGLRVRRARPNGHGTAPCRHVWYVFDGDPLVETWEITEEDR